VRGAAPARELPLDVHLMVKRSTAWSGVRQGANIISFHPEASSTSTAPSR